MSRPMRIVRGQSVGESVDESLFEVEEERVLFTAAKAAAERMHSGMSIPEFLEV